MSDQTTNKFILPLPVYHRAVVVRALKIAHVIPNPRGFEMHFEDQRYAPISFAASWIKHHQPEPGQYFVIDDDNEPFLMSAEDFESRFVAGSTLEPSMKRIAQDGSVILVTYPNDAPQNQLLRDLENMRASAEFAGLRLLILSTNKGDEFDFAELPEDTMNAHGWYRQNQEAV